MRIKYKAPRTTKKINSKVLMRVASEYEMATMWCDEGEDLSKYDHLSKKPKYRPCGRIYVPHGLDKRLDDFSGKLVIYDYDNDKRTVCNFKYWLKLQKDNRFRKDSINKNLVKYLPKLKEKEFIKVVSWVYPYYFFRLPIKGT